MTRSATRSVGVVELTDTESAAMFDRVARREMGISGAEFLERLDAGEWDDLNQDDVPGLLSVWMYLPAVR
ncbi:hypothetical protein [Amycolatopsis sp. NPDC051371]|uniref:hypothetical protein n=1 Tax=Amycolatopsis sp. NPDC051371 TaxID=3155800 RepID=UPI003434E731